MHDELGSNGDEMVQKLQAVIGSDNYPDIAYVYGSDVPNVSQSNKVVDISKDIKATGFDWNSLYPAGRETATVGSKVVGFPGRDRQPGGRLQHEDAQGRRRRAAQGELDVERLPRDGEEAHEREARASIGTGYPISGSEDTVWRLWPMIWQQGGEVLDSANKKALFAGAQGVEGAATAERHGAQGQVALPRPVAGHR